MGVLPNNAERHRQFFVFCVTRQLPLHEKYAVTPVRKHRLRRPMCRKCERRFPLGMEPSAAHLSANRSLLPDLRLMIKLVKGTVSFVHVDLRDDLEGGVHTQHRYTQIHYVRIEVRYELGDGAAAAAVYFA